ncbi:hypothetical protein CBS115989_3651 [Aspergillus niger]|uniref:Cytochrome P450 n=1 Tax=Aspergillus niger ATCC 13496 TaxID=1353008 RepID=A0A370CE39_ASPNG|nr:cytochrome P450 [Aspergillus niger CBS 513.88]XP_025457825.1 cytochrome P450 [Aspergillus niger CBS 101883]KAI2820521.1 hypothetical protein CBS115989_3651 [Aspergillus niger]RDH24450.1 cytochrome P450 [Aspergillus niger ATCC 13496]KAI2837008.1 hypothetical protein CBS11350_9056 [Aspergillus niger]KAI2837799.1 hypothetical protein CBS12448_10932 [Aspergillus niger]KAI2861299.1 hypothetical protein CBS11232_935 [Aspergillus niger]|eukprot:XP_001396538.2 cytochrome P450 [Aspergillus niger CBS 513.88]
MQLFTEIIPPAYFLPGFCLTVAVLVLLSCVQNAIHNLPYYRIPAVGMSRWSLFDRQANVCFMASARALIREGFEQGHTMFQAMFPHGPMLVLHPKYVDEVRRHPSLSLEEAVKESLPVGDYPGFEAFRGTENHHILLDVINQKITRNLKQYTIPLARETELTLDEHFGQPQEWKSYCFASEVPYIVARLSTLVFLGEQVCRDTEWLDISVNYTLDIFGAITALRGWPPILRPVVHWFLEPAQKLRKRVQVARRIVQREMRRRQHEHKPRQPDALDWLHEVAGGRHLDVTTAQIGLTLVTIHTTSNLLTNVIYDLAANPQYLPPLREEIQSVLETDGTFHKTSLTKMKLLDSVVKESQRLNPPGLTSLHRYAMEEITLSDATVIPKGASLVVSAHTMQDESIYLNAHTYDGYRFYRKRQEPGHENKHQLVMTSAEHYGFGHGVRACPGRFFATNEIKILLAHIILKYDIRFPDGQSRPANWEIGQDLVCDQTVQVLFRAR